MKKYGIVFTKSNYDWQRGDNEAHREILTRFSYGTYPSKEQAKDVLRDYILNGLAQRLTNDCTFNTVLNWHGGSDMANFNIGNGEEGARIVRILEFPYHKEDDNEKKRKEGYLRYIYHRMEANNCGVPFTITRDGSFGFVAGEFSELGVLNIVGFQNTYTDDAYKTTAMVVQTENYNWYMIFLEDLPYSAVERLAKDNFHFDE